MISLLPHDDAGRASISPKQHPQREQRDWYPYYAGFTEQFVENVLSADWHDFCNVLDPWSGSGTTTVVCTKAGLESKGLDINPALTVIARGRLVPVNTKRQLQDLAKQVVSDAHRATPTVLSADLLRLWFADDAVFHIRCIEGAIREECGMDQEDEPLARKTFTVDNFSVFESFLYTVLFASVRSVLAGFRSTNPMWIKTSANSKELANPSRDSLLQLFQTYARQLASLLSMPDSEHVSQDIPVSTGDATKLPFADHSFDSVITSPPYAARLDYVNGTLPELAILGATERSVANLRRQVTGSPVVRHVSDYSDGLLPSECANGLLEQIRTHPSKGSKNYYYPWLRNYIWKLKKGLDETDRTVKREGIICIVVQDSRYKELHINLQQIVTELLAAGGRSLKSRIDHPARNLRFSQVQIREARQQSAKNVETLLVYRSTTQ